MKHPWDKTSCTWSCLDRSSPFQSAPYLGDLSIVRRKSAIDKEACSELSYTYLYDAESTRRD